MFGSQDNNQGVSMAATDNGINPTPYVDNSYSTPTPPQDMGVPSSAPSVPSDLNSTLPTADVQPLNTQSPAVEPTPVLSQEVASTDLNSNLMPTPIENPDLEDMLIPGANSPKSSDPSMEMPKPMTSGNDPELDEIKNKALKEITPLLDKLNLPALEKFKTIMMTIQAGDSKELIPSAYEAAEKIEDESEKAQALLDVINEINYFSNDKS
jgi:hypothetical protein